MGSHLWALSSPSFISLPATSLGRTNLWALVPAGGLTCTLRSAPRCRHHPGHARGHSDRQAAESSCRYAEVKRETPRRGFSSPKGGSLHSKSLEISKGSLGDRTVPVSRTWGHVSPTHLPRSILGSPELAPSQQRGQPGRIQLPMPAPASCPTWGHGHPGAGSRPSPRRASWAVMPRAGRTRRAGAGHAPGAGAAAPSCASSLRSRKD